MSKKPIIFCIGAENEGRDRDYYTKQDFYVKVGKETYFLFRQNYNQSVQNYFEKGLDIDRAMRSGSVVGDRKCFRSWDKLDRCVLKIIDKLPSYIKYVEKEYGLAILEKTKKRFA